MAVTQTAGDRRVIGENPRRPGIAISYVAPTHAEACVIGVETGAESYYAILPTYELARSAAIRAIFCDTHFFERATLMPVTEVVANSPRFHSVSSWLHLVKKIAARTE